jgi:hypothetical protein
LFPSHTFCLDADTWKWLQGICRKERKSAKNAKNPRGKLCILCALCGEILFSELVTVTYVGSLAAGLGGNGRSAATGRGKITAVEIKTHFQAAACLFQRCFMGEFG